MPKIDLTGMPKVTERQPVGDDHPNGLLESDRDFVEENFAAAVWLLEKAVKAHGLEQLAVEHLDIAPGIICLDGDHQEWLFRGLEADRRTLSFIKLHSMRRHSYRAVYLGSVLKKFPSLKNRVL